MARLTAAERRRDEDFAGIMEGLESAIAITEGKAEPGTYRIHHPKTIDVKALREREGLSQPAFAAKYGISSSALKRWEQNRRQPETAALTLLRIIEREPEAVLRALAS